MLEETCKIKPTIGVLALQGGVREHCERLGDLGALTVPVKNTKDLEAIDGLIMPGGESTAIGKLMRIARLDSAIQAKAEAGLPVLGTCAGLILMSAGSTDSNGVRLGLIDVDVKRNAFGSQAYSFEALVEIAEVGPPLFNAVFIRAPWIERIGADVTSLATHQGRAVFVEQAGCLGCSFHPELTEDNRVHRYFLDKVQIGVARKFENSA